MSRKLGIMIDGVSISDEDAKILALYLMGLSNQQIYGITFIAVENIYNKVSFMYQLFMVPKIPTALTALALLSGFDHYGFVNGVDILNANERTNLEQLRPRLLSSPKKIVVTLQ